jgi:KTSC domain
MKREAVRSRSIKSIGYEHAKKVLEVEFRSGPRVYRYYGVPRRVYNELMTAESKGAFVNQVIKTFPYRENH